MKPGLGLHLRALALAPAFLALAGCGVLPWPERAAEPKPVELSYRPPPGDIGPERAATLAQALSGSYVRVQIVDRSEARAGRDSDSGPGIVTGASGVIVDGRGYVVTAAHIATDPKLDARIHTMDGRQHEATVVAVAPERELALIKMRPYPGIQVAKLGDSGALAAGDPVLAIGTPDDRQGVVFQGQVSNPRRAQRIQYGLFGYDDAIELVLDAEPGASGGPLFNQQGELVGIVASFSLGNTNPGYAPTHLAWAVPSNAIARYLREVAGR
jgi:S1-C subfamily serine protease